MRTRNIGIVLLAVSAILLFAWGYKGDLSDENKTEMYYNSIKDKDGFCIEDGYSTRYG